MSRDMRGRSNFATKHHHTKESSPAQTRGEIDRNIKTVIGEIAEVDPGATGKLFVTAWVRPPTGQGRRLWGDGGQILLTDSPTDVLLRFGNLRPGMKLEVSWRGIAETGAAWGRILGEGVPEGQEADEIPTREVDTQSSLPFEPFGLL